MVEPMQEAAEALTRDELLFLVCMLLPIFSMIGYSICTDRRYEVKLPDEEEVEQEDDANLYLYEEDE